MKDLLVIEDSAPERERLEKLFSGRGYAVETCRSVGEAEKSIQSETFRLAILDIGLTDKSGSQLFQTLKRSSRVSYIIIFTGNPSVHLKQRFIEEGAADYIVKGSPLAQNDNLLNRVSEVIGPPSKTDKAVGPALNEFLNKHVNEASRKLFLTMDNRFPKCKRCGAEEYYVNFQSETQIPPEIKGVVLCSHCQTKMEADIE